MLEYIVYCKSCREELYRAKNGQMVEAAGEIHADETGHTVIVGFEISPIKLETDRILAVIAKQ